MTTQTIEDQIRTAASEREAELGVAQRDYSEAVARINRTFVEQAVSPALELSMTVIKIAEVAGISRGRIHDLVREAGGR